MGRTSQSARISRKKLYGYYIIRRSTKMPSRIDLKLPPEKSGWEGENFQIKLVNSMFSFFCIWSVILFFLLFKGVLFAFLRYFPPTKSTFLLFYSLVRVAPNISMFYCEFWLAGCLTLALSAKQPADRNSQKTSKN